LTPCPKWDGGGSTGSGTSRGCSQTARRIAGSYRSLMSLALELGNSHTALPDTSGHENASVREGGRRWRSSQMPGCNGWDRVKDRQERDGRRADATPIHVEVGRSVISEPSMDLWEGCRLTSTLSLSGKRSARKRARSVWSRGKAVRPYLLLQSSAWPRFSSSLPSSRVKVTLWEISRSVESSRVRFMTRSSRSS
jgi:hypothetical protein